MHMNGTSLPKGHYTSVMGRERKRLERLMTPGRSSAALSGRLATDLYRSVQFHRSNTSFTETVDACALMHISECPC
jgi:hypothetical protein